ncbi:hypothetical protein LCGC14_2926840, partial [marine sediment metagenome]
MMTEEGIYARASDKLRDKLYLLKGQWFYKSDACEVCGVNNRTDHAEHRDAIGQVLYKWVHLVNPVLEQRGKKYWVIEDEFKIVKPNAAQSKRFNLKWPRGVDDNTSFSFAETAVVTQGDVMG